MRALVISGGGSKGAFAGGVAQYLMEDLGKEYDMFLGTSTGSLLIPHLSLKKVDKVYNLFTNVTQRDIFSVSPFVQRKKGDREYVSIDFINSLWQFIRMKRTFGESKHLKRNIRRNFTEEEFEVLLANVKVARGEFALVKSSMLTLKREGIIATAILEDGEFIIQKGSLVRAEYIGDRSEKSYYWRHYDKLVEQGILVDQGKHKVFTQSYAFPSTSAAGAVCNGRSTAGPTAWKVKGTKKTYKEWEAETLAKS